MLMIAGGILLAVLVMAFAANPLGMLKVFLTCGSVMLGLWTFTLYSDHGLTSTTMYSLGATLLMAVLSHPIEIKTFLMKL